jgi:hypothetical protein
MSASVLLLPLRDKGTVIFAFTLRVEDMQFVDRRPVTYLLRWPFISSSIHVLPILKGLGSNPALELGYLHYFSFLSTVRPDERWLSALNEAKTVSLRTVFWLP